MFSRYDCCYHCSHHYRHLTFRRGMAAMLILVVLVFALLHGQKPGIHHLNRAQTTHRPSGRAGRGHDPTRPRARQVPHRLPRRHSGYKSARLTVSWTNFHGIDLPVSTSAGPRTMRNGLASGFAQSPTGALLAASNIAVRTAAQWGPAIFRPTITQQVTGPAAGALLRADTDTYAQLRRASLGSRSKAASSSQAVEEAYRFVAYTPAAAIVEVVTTSQGASGSLVLVMTRLRVVWQRGDWRLYAPPDGDWANTATAISSLAGYTLLSAGR
jgi:hypothetical protein